MSKIDATKIRHQRIRKRVQGTTARPRLSVHFSGKNIYAQVIDDDEGKTIAAVSTTEKDFKSAKASRANKVTAEKVGKSMRSRTRRAKADWDFNLWQHHNRVVEETTGAIRRRNPT